MFTVLVCMTDIALSLHKPVYSNVLTRAAADSAKFTKTWENAGKLRFYSQFVNISAEFRYALQVACGFF